MILKFAPLTLATGDFANGSHTLAVVAQGSGFTAVSPGVPVTFNNAANAATALIVSQSPGPLRNNYSGFVGFAFTAGSGGMTVSSLGRFVAPGDLGSHLLKLVSADGTDVAGGSVTVATGTTAPGQYAYAALATPVTLTGGAVYFLVSQEVFGGDQWYDYGPVTSTSAASIIGPTYADAAGHYIILGGGAGSYVPLNLLYGGGSSPTLSATITSPASGATISGSNVPVMVSTSVAVVSFQLQVDGVNQGSAVSASPLHLDTTALANGPHTLTVLVTDASSNSAVSAGVPVTVNNGGTTALPFITGQTASSIRNNYSGFVGMSFSVGSAPVTVTQLGRLMVAGNTGTHMLKLVQANGTDVPGGSATVTLSSQAPGNYVYGALSAPVVLTANTSYYLVSQETAGGDSWYDLEPVMSTGVAQINGPTYTDGHGAYVLVGGLPNESYVPVNFLYH